jgi:hypothetical protein
MNEQVEALLKTLPRKIKVGAYDWRIKIETGENADYGLTDWDKYLISIWPEGFPTTQLAVGTVLHELLHVIHDNEAIGPPSEPDGYDEEHVVTGFETGLITLFRDNPKLLTWIKRGLK